jgi:carbamoyl-phosphate synthase/aspartate carbamoyltransferase
MPKFEDSLNFRFICETAKLRKIKFHFFPQTMLHLYNSQVFRGTRFGANTDAVGEVCFTTAMVSCELSLTDPSYAGQIIVFSYPLVGNHGIPDMSDLDKWDLEKHFESHKIHARGVIVLEACDSPTRNLTTLHEWLEEQNVPGLYGVHTRALVELLRDKGSVFGQICDSGVDSDDAKGGHRIDIGPSANISLESELKLFNEINFVTQVSRPDSQRFGSSLAEINLLVVDCGIKNSILRALLDPGNVFLKVVPYDADIIGELKERHYDALCISNGPGDPRVLTNLIQQLKNLIVNTNSGLSILGICLGHQLLALAAGASVRKMKFGNRGLNQSCIDLRTGAGYVTSQNHGYEVDADTLPPDWKPCFVNANDGSNEGIIHVRHKWMGVQFHPEANPGCSDTQFVLEEFVNKSKSRKMGKWTKPLIGIRKVLLLGSGGLSIGQAGEFDYSGSQAIKALQEENVEVVLINPNIATVQTTASTYYYPITPEFVTQIIEKEKPDGILLQFGGQTALNCGLALRDVLAKHNVAVLGTPLDTIVTTEDRAAFAQKMRDIGERTIDSFTVSNIQEALESAELLGYPVLVRAGFTLGGLGSGFASNAAELIVQAKTALVYSTHIIIDKSLSGFKEIEYEMVRDCQSNCIAVCNMENFDPVGIHTGDSIVVAPSQTLTNAEYFGMRATAVKVVNALGVVGECNIQFAVNPITSEHFIIEVNARLSRSSALASKATGYPLAYIAAKLSLGKLLRDIPNPMTRGSCTALFEPAMDYVVVKLPHWDFSKFSGVSRQLGTAMKSVGEVMGIGCVFEEAFMKAMRMNNIDFFEDAKWEEINTDKRIQALLTALRSDKSVEWIANETKIDVWFLHKLRKLTECTVMLSASSVYASSHISKGLLMHSKKLGFSDMQIVIAQGLQTQEATIRNLRRRYGIQSYANPIDTSAGEFKAESNYKYLSFHACDRSLDRAASGSVIVLGCGTYRIGSSCEFDWCAVNTLRTLKKQNIKCAMINHNPETVSTDYDECDFLYFEELSLETIHRIYQLENATGVIVGVGGQVPNCLAAGISQTGMKVYGSDTKNICVAEDRFQFSTLMDVHGIAQPEWTESVSESQALAFAAKTQYPVLVRPSYVLSGSAMNVACDSTQLLQFLKLATAISPEHPVVISKYFENAKELEYDAVAVSGKIINFAISEHVENAGTHSGDASLMLPAQKMYVGTLKKIRICASKIAALLDVTGAFNIQFLCKNNNIFVIECNLRASRSLPFVSKALNTNFVELATTAIMKLPTTPREISIMDTDHVCVKVPMFSYARLSGADPVCGVEMKATGEVACFASDANDAFLLALMAAGFRIPKQNILVTIGSQKHKQAFVASILELNVLNFRLFGTSGTCAFYRDFGVDMVELQKDHEKHNETNVVDFIRDHKVDLVINIPLQEKSQHVTDGFKIRRAAIDNNVPLISNLQQAEMLVEAFVHLGLRAGTTPRLLTSRASSHF